MVQLLKVHGSENHFFILDQTLFDKPIPMPKIQKLAQKITNSEKGLLNGADGILVVDASQHPDCLGKMVVVNADGSIASMCGNGLRTVSRYLSEKYKQNNFKVETLNADLKVSKQADFGNNVPAFSVEISPIRFNADAFPFDNLGKKKIVNTKLPALSDKLLFTAIAVPNPHLISFVEDEDLSNDTLNNLGTKLNQKNPYFPDGVNINFAKIIDKNTLFVKTFERGVGFTNACGTGMSSTSLAFLINYPDLCDEIKDITVYNPGGMVKTNVRRLNNQYQINLIGNATVTHKITISEQALLEENFNSAQIIDTGEEKDYQKFINNL
ncbi:diaminopimelate epimerase [Apilactobacillus sp. TMW 2.2459]|uniref:diaminopimelate epimerase n=1 Tax=Apilactobacillus xinyiensis TaxID=2841032 RepID=UPI00200F78C1|nr:diaminopimelate epimerase [Apilactobacillus xinyiensis]MCL0312032.1 diaminopimelate epimerase [Apilactobacillus xinyiensis]